MRKVSQEYALKKVVAPQLAVATTHSVAYRFCSNDTAKKEAWHFKKSRCFSIQKTILAPMRRNGR
jgi:hypothetical protein